jgi:hypothetical protein
MEIKALTEAGTPPLYAKVAKKYNVDVYELKYLSKLRRAMSKRKPPTPLSEIANVARAKHSVDKRKIDEEYEEDEDESDE